MWYAGGCSGALVLEKGGMLTMGFFQKDQPLWLPKGSIRAIIAIVVVVTWVLLLARGLEVAKEFYVVLGCVVTFYFQARENDRERDLEKHRLEQLTGAVLSGKYDPGMPVVPPG